MCADHKLKVVADLSQRLATNETCDACTPTHALPAASVTLAVCNAARRDEMGWRQPRQLWRQRASAQTVSTLCHNTPVQYKQTRSSRSQRCDGNPFGTLDRRGAAGHLDAEVCNTGLAHAEMSTQRVGDENFRKRD